MSSLGASQRGRYLRFSRCIGTLHRSTLQGPCGSTEPKRARFWRHAYGFHKSYRTFYRTSGDRSDTGASVAFALRSLHSARIGRRHMTDRRGSSRSRSGSLCHRSRSRRS